MANTFRTKVRFPLSQSAKDALKLGFPDASIEDDCMLIFSRGYDLQNYLCFISEVTSEVIVAEHTSSADCYESVQVVRYKDGCSETVERKDKYHVYHDAQYDTMITEEIETQIRFELRKYKRYATIEFFHWADRDRCFKVVKKGTIVEIVPIEKVFFRGSTN